MSLQQFLLMAPSHVLKKHFACGGGHMFICIQEELSPRSMNSLGWSEEIVIVNN